VLSGKRLQKKNALRTPEFPKGIKRSARGTKRVEEKEKKNLDRPPKEKKIRTMEQQPMRRKGNLQVKPKRCAGDVECMHKGYAIDREKAPR